MLSILGERERSHCRRLMVTRTLYIPQSVKHSSNADIDTEGRLSGVDTVQGSVSGVEQALFELAETVSWENVRPLNF